MRKNRGFSYLEMTVALALFGIALTGTTRLVVMQSRQISKLEGRLNPGTTSYLVPSADAWARKLGAAAAIESVDPGPSPPPPVTLIDDGDPGYTEFGPNWHDHERTAYQGLLRCNNGGDLAIARWEFPELPPREYKVFATWAAKDNQATNAPYTVYDGAVAEGTVTVNMEVAPSGEPFEGVPWEILGTFSITSGTLRVELSDDANEKVVADAVRIVPWGNQVEVLSVQKSFDSEEVTVSVSVTPLE